MKITESNICSLCEQVDYIEHFFFRCDKVQQLWIEIEKDIQANLGCRLNITEEMVILGLVNKADTQKKLIEKINHALSVGRLAVTKFRYGKSRNILEIYETESRIRKLWF